MFQRISFIALAFICATIAFGQDKKVAMLEPIVKGGTVTQMEKEIILAALEAAITKTPGYRAFTRLDVNQIAKEVSFQQSGMVDDSQRQRIGQMSGASLICISQLTAATAAKQILIKCSLVDVETGEIVNNDNLLMEKDVTAIYKGCQKLAASMLGGTVPATNAPANGAVYNPDGIEMVYVEGTGSGITAIEGFYIGKYEVTQAQYHAIMGVNPSKFKGLNNPVECVSWDNVQEFITKLKARTGRNYRLPTEAEWEYAAREGKKNSNYLYSGSDDINAVAWYKDNSKETTHPVGQKLPNALGIYDMSGNVLEWCEDFDNKLIESDGQSTKVYSINVIRGGCISLPDINNTVTSYAAVSSITFMKIMGFRVACSLK
jgi:hypothetical protein